MHNPLLSIIIPNYNNVDFLDECLLSVRMQTYSNLEIIVCDDNSTDCSQKVICRHAKEDTRIVPLFNQSNIGVSATRHRAIMHANGAYISTLDSDDFYCSDKKIDLELQVLKRMGRSDVIAFSLIDVVDINGHFIEKFQPSLPVKEGILLESFLTRSCMIPRDFLFSKQAYIECGGYDIARASFEDWDIKIRLAARNEFYCTFKDGIAYRRKGYGLSYRTPKELKKAQIEVFEKNIYLIKDANKRILFRETLLSGIR